MTSAVVFVTWGTQDIPVYTKYYIDQLACWFDEVHVVSNKDRPIDRQWFRDKKYFLYEYPNHSRDFEKHYYWMMEMGRQRVAGYSRLVMANDCLICYGPLDVLMNWALPRQEELVGINASNFPILHVQSYFLVLQGGVLEKVWDHFHKTGIVSPIKEVEQYELKISRLAASFDAMFPQGKRRGWDELFWLPFDEGIPLVKHQCIMPRKPSLLRQWQRRISTMAHEDTKAWQYLPVLPDPAYTHRADGAAFTLLFGDPQSAIFQQLQQEQT